VPTQRHQRTTHSTTSEKVVGWLIHVICLSLSYGLFFLLLVVLLFNYSSASSSFVFAYIAIGATCVGRWDLFLSLVVLAYSLSRLFFSQCEYSSQSGSFPSERRGSRRHAIWWKHGYHPSAARKGRVSSQSTPLFFLANVL